MALIVVSPVYHKVLPKNLIITDFPTGISNFYLEVSKKYLSDYYSLHTNCKIFGEIIGIIGDENLYGLEGMLVEFVLEVMPLGSVDNLFFSDKSWYEVRDYGIIPEETKLKVRLIEAVIDKERIRIFPKRDV